MGFPLRQIAQELNLSESGVRRHLKRWGIDIQQRSFHGHKHTAEAKEKMRRKSKSIETL